MRNYAVACVRALGVERSLCHVELRYTDAGPLLLEVNVRIGAGCVADSLETFCGIDTTDTQLGLLLGDDLQFPSRPLTEEPHAMIFFFTPRSGCLEAVEGLERLMLTPGVRAVRQMTAVGERVGGDNEEQFVAGVWARAADADAAIDLHRRLSQRVRIRVG